jgi:putative transposase
VWVLDPASNRYIEIPYRSLSNPSVTLWEHRKAIEKLQKQGREQVNESAIFRMISKMREITEMAAKERKRARRDKTRRSHLAATKQMVHQCPDNQNSESSHTKPFDDIEEW